jgi:hypothetical protein
MLYAFFWVITPGNYPKESIQRIQVEHGESLESSYTMFFIIISTLHVSGSFSAHHQELIKLYVQPWVLSCFPTSGRQQESLTMPKVAHRVL